MVGLVTRRTCMQSRFCLAGVRLFLWEQHYEKHIIPSFNSRVHVSVILLATVSVQKHDQISASYKNRVVFFLHRLNLNREYQSQQSEVTTGLERRQLSSTHEQTGRDQVRTPRAARQKTCLPSIMPKWHSCTWGILTRACASASLWLLTTAIPR